MLPVASSFRRKLTEANARHFDLEEKRGLHHTVLFLL